MFQIRLYPPGLGGRGLFTGSRPLEPVVFSSWTPLVAAVDTRNGLLLLFISTAMTDYYYSGTGTGMGRSLVGNSSPAMEEGGSLTGSPLLVHWYILTNPPSATPPLLLLVNYYYGLHATVYS